MKLLPLLRTTALVALLVGPASAQRGIAVHLGTPGQSGPLLLVDESSRAVFAGPTKLDGVSFLPLEVNGRTLLDALLPGSVGVVDDLAGARRAVLPEGGGNLYHHRRALPSGELRFGFLQARGDGGLRVLLERAGTGPQGAVDPFHARVAIARGGGALLAATTLAAGGDLITVDLADGAVEERSSLAPALVVDARSLTLADGFGLAVTDRGLLRFAQSAGAQVQHVNLGGPGPDPAYFGGELVQSRNGAFCVTAAGDAPDAAHTWVVGASGPARRASAAPGKVTMAGFLPEYRHGPFFAVADDGGCAAWREEIWNEAEMKWMREAFVREVDAPASTPAVQITADAYFVDTLDEVGVLTIFGLAATIVAVGELSTAPGGGIEAAELYRVTIDANGDPQYENLSNTGPAGPTPFGPGEMALDAVHELPGTDRLLVYDGNYQGQEALLAVDTAQPGLAELVDNTRELDFVARAGDWLAVAIERDTPARPRELFRLPADLSGPPMMVASGVDREYLRPVARGDGQLAWLTRLDAGPELIQRVDLTTGAQQDFPLGQGQYGEALGLSPRGALVFTREPGAGGVRFVVWPFGQPGWSELALAPSSGHLVPGR